MDTGMKVDDGGCLSGSIRTARRGISWGRRQMLLYKPRAHYGQFLIFRFYNTATRLYSWGSREGAHSSKQWLILSKF
jgi:hypothetical protein